MDSGDEVYDVLLPGYEPMISLREMRGMAGNGWSEAGEYGSTQEVGILPGSWTRWT